MKNTQAVSIYSFGNGDKPSPKNGSRNRDIACPELILSDSDRQICKLGFPLFWR